MALYRPSWRIEDTYNSSNSCWGWLTARGACYPELAVLGQKPGPFFWPINKGSRLKARRMTTQAISNMMGKRAGADQVKRFSPHDMRRTLFPISWMLAPISPRWQRWPAIKMSPPPRATIDGPSRRNKRQPASSTCHTVVAWIASPIMAKRLTGLTRSFSA